MKAIIPDSVKELEEIKLIHPRTEEETTFLKSNGIVYEPRVYNQEIGSFFIGNSVDPDTSVTFISKVDELFLILPVLLKHRKQFRSLTDILSEDENLFQFGYETSLSLVCDVKDIDDTKYYRYSQEKVIDWIKSKIAATSKVVIEKKINFSSKSSGMVILMGKTVSLDDVELQRYCFRLIADYLSEDTAKEFSEILGLREPEDQEESTELSGGDPPVECSNSGKPKEDYYKSPTKEEKQAQEKKVLTRAQKNLMKVDKTGMKSIESFFSKRK